MSLQHTIPQACCPLLAPIEKKLPVPKLHADFSTDKFSSRQSRLFKCDGMQSTLDRSY